MPRYLHDYTIDFFLNDILSVANKKFHQNVDGIVIKKCFNNSSGLPEVFFILNSNQDSVHWSLRSFLNDALYYNKCIYSLEKIYYNKPWWCFYGRKITGFKLKISKTQY